jgi:hypothetical protein
MVKFDGTQHSMAKVVASLVKRMYSRLVFVQFKKIESKYPRVKGRKRYRVHTYKLCMQENASIVYKTTVESGAISRYLALLSGNDPEPMVQATELSSEHTPVPVASLDEHQASRHVHVEAAQAALVDLERFIEHARHQYEQSQAAYQDLKAQLQAVITAHASMHPCI